MVTAGILGMFVGATLLALGYQLFVGWVAERQAVPSAGNRPPDFRFVTCDPRSVSEADTFARPTDCFLVSQYLLNNLLLGLPTMAACLVLQALLASSAISYYRGRAARVTSRSFWTTTGVITGVMILLVLGNLAQIGVWALLFRLLGEFEQFGDAFYHSSVNFATLGYGDVVMSARHRLLGPLEAVNGALMIGASTATLMVAFEDVMRRPTRERGA